MQEHPEKRRILVADRDQQLRKLEEFFLTEAGFAGEFVDNGEIALERARLDKPDLVITEILIPRLDGLALCRALRDDPATSEIPNYRSSHDKTYADARTRQDPQAIFHDAAFQRRRPG